MGFGGGQVGVWWRRGTGWRRADGGGRAGEGRAAGCQGCGRARSASAPPRACWGVARGGTQARGRGLWAPHLAVAAPRRVELDLRGWGRGAGSGAARSPGGRARRAGSGWLPLARGPSFRAGPRSRRPRSRRPRTSANLDFLILVSKMSLVTTRTSFSSAEPEPASSSSSSSSYSSSSARTSGAVTRRIPKSSASHWARVMSAVCCVKGRLE